MRELRSTPARDGSGAASSEAPEPAARSASITVLSASVVAHLVRAAVTVGARRWAAAGAAVFVAVISLYRLGVSRTATFAGHADPAFYFGVAQNLHAGRGPVVDYAWHFLGGQPPLPRYAFDYWYPLPSYLMAFVMHGRDQLAEALHASLIASVIACVGCYVLARVLTTAWWVPAAATCVYCVQPTIDGFSLTTDSPIFLAAVVPFALTAAVLAPRRVWLWPIAGALAGLANLARSEGLLVAVVIVLGAAVSGAGSIGTRGPRARRAAAYAGSAVLGWVVVMSPFFVMNEHHLGRLFPVASGRFPFVTSFEDLFATSVPRSVSAFVPDGPGVFVTTRLSALGNQLRVTASGFTTVDVAVLLVLTGVLLAHRRSVSSSPAAVRARRGWAWARAPWTPPIALFALAELFFIGLIPALSTAGVKWELLFQSSLVIAGLVGLHRTRWPAVVTAVLVLILVALPTAELSERSRETVRVNNAIGRGLALPGRVLDAESACLGRPAVLMTRFPWELTLATGYRTVMIPNDSLSTILSVARHYGVTDLQLPGKLRSALTRPAQLTVRGGPLIRLTTTDRTGILRLRQAAPQLRCDRTPRS